MLKTAAGEKGQEVSISNLLMEPSEGGRSFLEKFLDGLDVTQKLQVQFQQAGLDWTPLKFVVMALVCASSLAACTILAAMRRLPRFGTQRPGRPERAAPMA